MSNIEVKLLLLAAIVEAIDKSYFDSMNGYVRIVLIVAVVIDLYRLTIFWTKGK